MEKIIKKRNELGFSYTELADGYDYVVVSKNASARSLAEDYLGVVYSEKNPADAMLVRVLWEEHPESPNEPFIYEDVSIDTIHFDDDGISYVIDDDGTKYVLDLSWAEEMTPVTREIVEKLLLDAHLK